MSEPFCFTTVIGPVPAIEPAVEIGWRSDVEGVPMERMKEFYDTFYWPNNATVIIAGDAWFCAIGLVAGLLIGLAAWRWLRSLGWTVVLVVLVCAVASALTCWLVGYRLGPGDFSARLAAAQPGQLVPIPLTLRARASLLVWPFFAIIPVLLGSSIGRDEEEPRPLLRGRARSGHETQ